MGSKSQRPAGVPRPRDRLLGALLLDLRLMGAASWIDRGMRVNGLSSIALHATTFYILRSYIEGVKYAKPSNFS